jgi:hypothetical protein
MLSGDYFDQEIFVADDAEMLHWSHDRLFNEVCNMCFGLFAQDAIDEEDTERIMDAAQDTDDLGLIQLIKNLRRGEYV